MQAFYIEWFLIGLLAILPLADSSPISLVPSLPLPSRILYQFPDPTWIENIAVRRNGALLLTVLSPNASLYEIPDPTSANPSISLVHSFPEVNGLFGIAETAPDVFAIAASNFSGPGVYENGTTVVFSVDFNKRTPHVKTIVSIPEAGGPNGVTTSPEQTTTVLVADSLLGQIWAVDTLTGMYSLALKAPEMAPIPGAALAIGINGLRSYLGDLYFVNSGNATLYRINSTDCGHVSPHTAIEIVAALDAESLDDFTINNDGTAYLATNVDNRVLALKLDGTGIHEPGVVVEGAVNSSLVAGDTSGAFGRTRADTTILYMVTDKGGISTNGTSLGGGKVVAIETGGY